MTFALTVATSHPFTRKARLFCWISFFLRDLHEPIKRKETIGVAQKRATDLKQNIA